MPTDAKQAAVAELVELFKEADTTIVSDHRGLSVADLQKVRRELRAKDIQYRIIKNRLAKIAAEQADRPELVPLLVGPSAIAIGGPDESTLAKGLVDATKPFKVEIRGAALNGETVDAAAVSALAALPGREQLLAQLAGGFGSPLSTMAGLFAAPLRNLGYGLQQLKEQREGAEAA
jgi:large subunit ribosomal protein L10